ncbi:hypothetical protein Bbelb_435640 [Branchiostoma belcheri]|nr:hypothetical protein Bbelb_435640 [Branchiostoma belcheri]
MIQPSWLAFYILAFRALKETDIATTRSSCLPRRNAFISLSDHCEDLWRLYRLIKRTGSGVLCMADGMSFYALFFSVFILVGSGAQGNGGTPRAVTAVVGESVTLPAAFSTRENILSVTWSKVNTDQSTVQQREPVFVFSNGNSKSHGAYKDRVLLSGKVSLRIANIRVQDDGMYVLNVMTEDLETGEEYVRLIVMEMEGKLDGRRSVSQWVPALEQTAGKVPSYSNMVIFQGSKCPGMEHFAYRFLPSWAIYCVESSAATVPPVVKVGPSSPVVSSWGKSVTFKCTISEARPNISALHWEKDGIPVQSIGVSSKYSGGTLASPSLTVRHVTRADTGSYTCVHQSCSGANITARRVPAARPLTDTLDPASIISISDAIAVTVSDRVTLQCVADGNPPPNITWTKNGVLLPSVAHTLSNDVRASSVTLKRVRMNNTGAYVCAASNGVGKSDSKAVQLSVTPDKDARDSSNIVVIVGTVAGALWFLIGVVLILLLWKRRRDRRDKERFAFYYNMGRREPGAPDDKTDFPTIPVTCDVSTGSKFVGSPYRPPSRLSKRADLSVTVCHLPQGNTDRFTLHCSTGVAAIDAFPNVVTGNCIYNAVPNVQTLKDILRRLLFSKVSCRIHVKSQEYLTSSMIFTDTPLATVYLIL